MEQDFTDQDLNDPSLLAELAKLGLSDPVDVAVGQVDHVEIHTEFEDVEVEFDDKDMEDPDLLKDLQRLHDTAIDREETVDDHNQEQQTLRNSKVDTIAKNQGELDQGEDQEDLLKELIQGQASKPIVSPSIDQLETLQAKVLELKKTALKFKKENNLVKAREALIGSKKVQEQIDRITSGFAVSPGFVIPDLTVQSPNINSNNSNTNTIDAANVTSTSSSNESRKSIRKEVISPKILQKDIIPIIQDDKFDPLKELETKMESTDIFKHLSDVLNEQIKTCTNLSAYYFKSGKKDKALEFHKYKKGFLSDLEALLALSKTSGAAPPTFSYFNISYNIEIRISELSMDELLLNIVKGYDMNSFQGNELSISFKVEGLEDNGGTGEVLFQKENNPEIKFSKKISIQRNKNFQRILERKKVQLELYSSSTQFFIMKKKTLIAKTSLKLDNLLNKCEIHEIFSFIDPNNPRKSLNSKLEVKLCLSQPLLKPEIVSKQERWIQISFDNPENYNSPTNTQTIIKKEISKPVDSINKPDRVPKSSSPIPSTQESSDELEDALLSFKNVDLIVSNLVLEHESSEISREIQNLKSNGKTIPADLSDILLSYEIKMNLLVSLVQMGSLTPAAYLEQLNNFLKETKRLALTFKKANKTDEAQKAMIRIKLITREISEISID